MTKRQKHNNMTRKKDNKKDRKIERQEDCERRWYKMLVL